MDAKNMGIKAIKEGINRENYFITGITENGEIVLAILSDLEKTYLNKVLEKDINDDEKLKLTQKLMSVEGRPAKEIMQVYHQNTAEKNEICLKNGLRIK